MLFKKYFTSAFNLSVIRTLLFNWVHLKSFRPLLFIGKRTKVFFKGGSLSINKKAYFDCKNAGQFWHDSTIVLEKNSLLSIGSDVNFFSAAQIKCFEGAEIKIGKNSYFSGPVVIHAKEYISIGEHCSISWNVTIMDSNFHKIKLDEPISSDPVIIEDDVWIGCNVTILKGVRLGKGSVVAAGSIVTKSIEDNAIYAGNPAKKIGMKDV